MFFQITQDLFTQFWFQFLIVILSISIIICYYLIFQSYFLILILSSLTLLSLILIIIIIITDNFPKDYVQKQPFRGVLRKHLCLLYFKVSENILQAIMKMVSERI